MSDTIKPYTLTTDYVTGKEIPNIGAEQNRQAVERFLVEKKGFSKQDIIPMSLHFLHIGIAML